MANLERRVAHGNRDPSYTTTRRKDRVKINTEIFLIGEMTRSVVP